MQFSNNCAKQLYVTNNPCKNFGQTMLYKTEKSNINNLNIMTFGLSDLIRATII